MSYNNQLPVIQQYFTNIAAIKNVGVLQQIRLYKIIWSMLVTCENTTMWVYGAWIKTYYALYPKTYNLEMCHNQPLIHDKLLGVPASVKLVYSQSSSWMTQTCLFHITDIMAADDLPKQGARVSAALVLI